MLDIVQILLAVCLDQVVVDAVSQLGQGAEMAVLGLMDKVLDIPPAADFQVGLDLTVDGVLNHDILQAAAVIDDGQQLSLHILCSMLELEKAVLDGWIGLVLVEVAAIGTDDGGTVSPQQGDVLDDDLPGHLEGLGQVLAVEGTGGSL